MSKYCLGEFEEVVLLIVVVLYGKVYGVVILLEIEECLNWEVSIGLLCIVLNCLEKKGCLFFEFGELIVMWGGKCKCFFKVMKYG